VQRLEPQLASSVTEGELGATPEQAAEAQRLHASAMATALLLDRQLLRVAEHLDREGRSAIVVKGAAVAHLDREDPSRRSYGDLDLLVTPQDVAPINALLAGLGGTRTYEEPRAGYDRRFGKGMSFRMPDGLEVDVHRTLALGPFGLAIDLRDLVAGQESFVVGTRRMTALDRPRRFLHACYHAMLGRAGVRLVPLLDVARCEPRSESEAEEVRRLACSWRADLVVEEAISATVRQLGWRPSPLLAPVLAELAPTSQQRRWMRAYRGGGRSSARLTIEGITALHGWRDRLDYLRAVAWPSNLDARRAAQRLSRGAKELNPRRRQSR
jgi:hypothetical protein